LLFRTTRIGSKDTIGAGRKPGKAISGRCKLTGRAFERVHDSAEQMSGISDASMREAPIPMYAVRGK
jgi:hypothetical protein